LDFLGLEQSRRGFKRRGGKEGILETKIIIIKKIRFSGGGAATLGGRPPRRN